MRTRQTGTPRTSVKYVGTTATLSIVVVSSGRADLSHRAARVLMTTSASFGAQIIMVGQGEVDAGLATLLNRGGGQFVAAPVGSTRAEMCDLGMSRVTGTIVAVRDDYDVGDADWLSCFRRIIPQVAVEPVRRERAIAVGEHVVMDSMLPGAGSLGDARPARQQVSDHVRSPVASVEMAAIM